MCKTNHLSVASQYELREVEKPSLHSKVDILTTQQVANKDGVLVEESKFVVDDSEHRFDGMKADDFALSNLLASGANLVPASCDLSSFEAVGYAAYSAERLSQFVKSQKSE